MKSRKQISSFEKRPASAGRQDGTELRGPGSVEIQHPALPPLAKTPHPDLLLGKPKPVAKTTAKITPLSKKRG
jgi:hypothetical protein